MVNITLENGVYHMDVAINVTCTTKNIKDIHDYFIESFERDFTKAINDAFALKTNIIRGE